MQALSMKYESTPEDLFFVKDGNFLKKSQEIYHEVYEGSLKDLSALLSFDTLTVYGSSNEKIFESSPLKHHLVVTPSGFQKGLLSEALKVLDHAGGEDWRLLRKTLHGLVLTKLDQNFHKTESQITSITLPGLPFISLFSEKAFFHAPPLLLKEKPDPVILAENLIHEATHQWVNLNIVENHFFEENYSSLASPKILIPWRTKAFYPRDREWPLDRCLHACLVYLVVARFRSRVQRQDRFPSPYADEDLKAAVDHGTYLAEKLFEHRKAFTASAENVLLCSLRSFKEVL